MTAWLQDMTQNIWLQWLYFVPIDCYSRCCFHCFIYQAIVIHPAIIRPRSVLHCNWCVRVCLCLMSYAFYAIKLMTSMAINGLFVTFGNCHIFYHKIAMPCTNFFFFTLIFQVLHTICLHVNFFPTPFRLFMLNFWFKN